MSLFDELRNNINHLEDFLFGGELPCRLRSDVIKAIDDFEMAHPGLVDHTVECAECGRLIDSTADDTVWVLAQDEPGSGVYHERAPLCAPCGEQVWGQDCGSCEECAGC
jgi:hypothetical protein